MSPTRRYQCRAWPSRAQTVPTAFPTSRPARSASRPGPRLSARLEVAMKLVSIEELIVKLVRDPVVE